MERRTQQLLKELRKLDPDRAAELERRHAARTQAAEAKVKTVQERANTLTKNAYTAIASAHSDGLFRTPRSRVIAYAACAGQRHRGRSSVRPSSRRTRGTRRIRTASSSSTDPSGDPEPEGVGRSKDLTRAGAPARASEYRAHSGPTAAGARVVLPVHVAVRPETRLASRGPEVFSRRHP